jgi:hypothetical protein
LRRRIHISAVDVTAAFVEKFGCLALAIAGAQGAIFEAIIQEAKPGERSRR